MLSIPLDAYLEILKGMSTEDHPYIGHETHEKELGEAATAMAHAVAKFVEVGREALGYELTRSTLEDIVHTFPADESADPLAAIQEALLKAMAEAPEVFVTEADGVDGAPKEN